MQSLPCRLAAVQVLGLLDVSPSDCTMRVAYILKKFPRLSETFVLGEILGLEEAGIDVSVYSLRLPDDGRWHQSASELRASVRYLPPFGAASVLEAFHALERVQGTAALSRALEFLARLAPEKRTTLLVQALHLASSLEKDPVDHLHAHFMTVAAHVTYLVHLFTGIPFTVTAHAKDIYRHTVDPAVFKEVSGAAQAVVTVCDANRRYIADCILDGHPAEVVRVYNGVALNGRLAAESFEQGLILGVGRLVEKKGWHILLEACRILTDKGVDTRCAIIGEGEGRDALLAQRRRLGLENRVTFTGALTNDEVLRHMSRAHVLAAPCVVGSDGNQDALPTVLLEALASGLPTVATPVGGVPEIVEHEVDGLLVSTGNPGALAAAIARVLRDRRLRARLARSGRAKAAARFDRRSTTRHLIEVFSHAGRAARAPVEVAG